MSEKEVVRCIDCKHYKKELLRGTAKVQAYCGRFFLTVPPEWYCADGVKRDDESRENQTDG